MSRHESTVAVNATAISMPEYKRLVAVLAAERPDTALELEFFGGANQITGYRLYYMLDHAKRAGVRRVTLLTDGAFWIDEASDWLIECRVDEVGLDREPPPGSSLATRIEAFVTRAGAPAVVMRN